MKSRLFVALVLGLLLVAGSLSTTQATTAGIAHKVCVTQGNAKLCAWMSKGSPTQNSSETVFGQFWINGQPQSGKAMQTAWHYKSATSSCTGSTNAQGIASCKRSIGRATIGYWVNVDVTIQGHKVTTWFVPKKN